MDLCDHCKTPLGADDCCPDCGVYHGKECEECGQRGYHEDGCPESDEAAAEEARRCYACDAAAVGYAYRYVTPDAGTPARQRDDGSYEVPACRRHAEELWVGPLSRAAK